ncbi:MAG TPA: DUF2125 domain-containing protein [Rhizomicrobium sp.]|jgi:hypothetical protein
MRYSSRLFLYAPLIVLVMLTIAASAHWQSVAGGLESWLRRSNGHEIAPGVTLRFASESVGGFPFNVDAVLTDVTIGVRTAFGPARWHTERFALHELTFGRAQQIYEAAGSQTLSWIDAEHVPHHFAFVPGSLQASAISSQARLVRFDLDINGIGSRALSGARAQLHFRKSPGHDAIDLVFSADGLHLARDLRAGFGAEISHILVQARLTPAGESAPLFGGNDSWDGALEKWRRSHGALRLDRADVNWGKIRAQGSGAISLDAAHRLTGSLALVIAGAPQLRNAEPGDARLTHALEDLTKVGGGTPLHILATFASGAVNLRLTRVPQTATSAGKVGALY